MATKIGPVIGIDGYKEYRDNMARILAQLAAVEAQTKALDAQYRGQTNSLEYLTKKEKLQAEALKLQTEATKQSTEWTNKVTQALEKKEQATTRDQAQAAKQVAANERVNASFAKTEAELNETRQAIDRYNQGTEEIIESSDNAAVRVNAFSLVVGNLVSRLIEAGVQAGKQFGKMGVGFNAQMESYTANFSTLLGDEKAALDVIGKIQQAAKKAPVFSFDSLTKSVQAITATGRPAETSLQTILNLANAVAASGGGNDVLERMAQNLQQIGNAGKATAMDIRQFAYAGIPLFNLVADAMGITVEEASQMELTFDDIARALEYAASEQGRFYNGLEKQANTLNGQWSRFKNNLNIRAGDVFSGLSDFLKDFLLPLGNAVLESEKLGDNITVIGSGVATLVVGSQITKWTTQWAEAVKAVQALNAAATAGGLAQSLKTEAGLREMIVALLTKQVALTELVSTKTFAAAGAWGLLAAGVAATVNQTIKFNKAVESMGGDIVANVDTSNINEVRAKIQELRGELDAYREQMANMGDGGTLGFGAATDYAAKVDAYTQLMDIEREYIKQQEELAAYEQSEEGRFSTYINNVKNELQSLHEAAQEVFDNAMQAAQKEFTIFDAVGALAYTSTATVQSNLQSQAQYWEQYAANLQMVSDSQTGLSKELLAVLSDGSEESAALLNSIVQDVQAAGGFASSGGQQILLGINDSWAAVTAAQEQYALQTEETLVGAAQRTVEIIEQLPEALERFNVPGEMKSAAVSDINSFKNGLWGQAGSLNTTSSTIGKNAGRALTDSFKNAVKGTLTISANGQITFNAVGGYKNGLDYVPYNNFPAILHEGERVLTKAENRAYNAGLNPNGGGITNTANYYLYAQTIDNDTLDYITAYVDRQLGELTS